MKPPLFDYYDPSQLDEALALLREFGEDARVLAGGQSLGPMLNMRAVYPQAVVDINRIDELNTHSLTANGSSIGATCRQSDLEDDADLPVLQPLLAAALPHIAHRAIRNRGTVGGSLSHADPAAEWGALALALDAELVLQRCGVGRRLLPASRFFTGLLSTALEDDELLVEVRLPAWRQQRGWSFLEISRRHGDFALAGVAAWIDLDDQGRCSDARIAMIGVGESPMRIENAEKLLLGEAPDPRLFAEAANLTAQTIDPPADIHATAMYRRRLASVLVDQALGQSLERLTSNQT